VVPRPAHRRHLDASQRALVAAKIATLGHGGDRSKASIEALPTQREAADLLNVSRPSVQRARVVLDHGVPAVRRTAAGDWARVGDALRMVEGSVQWWLGDWCNFGEARYHEKYSQALDATDYELGTIKNAAYVAGNFPSSRRRDDLSFGHHQNVVALTPKQQDRWLDLASVERWSVQELRARLKKANLVAEHGELQAQAFPVGQFAVVHADPPFETVRERP